MLAIFQYTVFLLLHPWNGTTRHSRFNVAIVRGRHLGPGLGPLVHIGRDVPSHLRKRSGAQKASDMCTVVVLSHLEGQRVRLLLTSQDQQKTHRNLHIDLPASIPSCGYCSQLQLASDSSGRPCSTDRQHLLFPACRAPSRGRGTRGEEVVLPLLRSRPRSRLVMMHANFDWIRRCGSVRLHQAATPAVVLVQQIGIICCSGDSWPSQDCVGSRARENQTFYVQSLWYVPAAVHAG